ncbi:gustatory receptor 9 [Nasonia vitripennis]|uniref:Gustatory receptor n=1 Tax=Nasonia vitripennis TaxID=7425 RepID=A0A7M6UDT4_NASVI|nr:gustatory receptor 9 [Nasonia vitripennis]
MFKKVKKKYSTGKKWKIFSATDFLSLIKPSLLVCRFFGLISYKILNGKIEQSKNCGSYCAIVTFVYICASLLILYIINVSPYMNRASTWMLQGNCFYTLVNFMLVSNFVFKSSTIKILQNLADTTAKLPSEKFVKISKWIHSKDLVLYLLLLLHVPKVFVGNIYAVLSKIIGTYAAMTIYLLDFQYNSYVFIIASCFEHINEELVQLNYNACKERGHLLRRVYHHQFNPLLFVKLRYLKQWHYELNEIIRKINSNFSLQVVATVIMTFTELTFGLYFYILDRRHKVRSLDKEIWYFYYHTMVMYFSTKLLLLTLTCQYANNENYKTRTIVNEIIISTDNKLFKEEIYLFSLQLLHTDNKFIAKGVQLDATLLTGMAKGIFTYLLILIQFLITN